MAIPCALVLALGMGVASKTSAAYPERPIRMIVGYPAGGSGDIVARTLADPLSKALGQPVVVENIPGASGGIGTQRVIAAPADGYTIQLANMTEIVLNPLITPDLPYNAERGLAPVAFLGSVPSILIGRKNLAANTLPELLVEMRGAPKPLSAGTTGAGTPQHLALEMLRTKAGVPMLPVHYKGGAPALADVIGGHVDLAMITLTAALPHLKAGTFKAFGVTTSARSPLAPDVPAFSEVAGLAGFDVASWFAVYAPSKTPPGVLAQLESAILALLKDPEVRAKLEQQGMTVTPADRDALGRRVREDLQSLQAVVKAADIKPEK